MVSNPAITANCVGNMEAFPSQSERTVAATLLLLSSKSPCPCFHSLTSPSCNFEQFYSNKKSNYEEDAFPSESKSSSSSSLISDGSTGDSRADQLRVLADAAGFHDIKLKVVRRSRSKQYLNFDRPKNLLGEWRKPVIITSAPLKETIQASSLSCASTVVHGAGGQYLSSARKKGPSGRGEKFKREKFGSACMRRRAESILNLLSVGCFSEVRIRHVLGDSPDTSKALRMLLKLEEIKRSGAGGHKDPYVYMVVRSGSDVDSV